jgi:Lon protease-like protein
VATLRLFPLNTVLFPGANLNLHVFEPRYRQMISECLAGGEAFGVVLIRDGAEAGDPDVMPHEVGTTAEIDDVTPLPAGRYYISTVGRRRFKIVDVIRREPFMLVQVEYLDEDDDEDELRELVDLVRDEFNEYLRLLVAFSGAPADVDVPHDPVDASYLIGDTLQVADAMKQRLLELPSTKQRLTVELEFLRRLLPQLRSLVERKTKAAAEQQDAAPGGAFRSHQEKFFGKYFSMN